MPRHIRISLLKTSDKEKKFKALEWEWGGEGRPIMYKRTKVRMTAEFYLETMQARNSVAISLKIQKRRKKLSLELYVP